MDDRLTPEQKDELIESTLHDLPLASLPRDLTADVMSRVRITPLTRFRLEWRDALLSLVIALSIFAAWIGIRSLPALVVVQLRIQGILLWQKFLVNAYWLVPYVCFAIGFGFGLLALTNLRHSHRA